jgi:methionyl aminopeptidase
MSIDTQKDLEALKEVGRIVRLALNEMRKQVRAGATTAEVDVAGAAVLEREGAKSAPVTIYGFPAATCISVNDEIVHGIPSERMIMSGDLVKLDVTAEKDGYIADAAITVPVVPMSDEKLRLITCAEKAFYQGLLAVRVGHCVNEVGRMVEREVRRNGFTVIPQLSGHGVGRAIHEEPPVPNYFDPRMQHRLTAGLVITLEPIICMGSGRIRKATDGWTIKTEDGEVAAHFEHTVVVTNGSPLLLTAA